MIKTTVLLALLLSVTTSAQQPPAADPHAQMNARGEHVMGFDQHKTVHQFRLHTDGGAIDIRVKDRADQVNVSAIRSHLPHIAETFGGGNFEAPMLIHATDVPGTKAMAAAKDRIRFAYVETPVGGRVDIITTQPAALKAVHEFLRFQIADHRTGDSTAITKR
jgi:hypothetical protein